MRDIPCSERIIIQLNNINFYYFRCQGSSEILFMDGEGSWDSLLELYLSTDNNCYSYLMAYNTSGEDFGSVLHPEYIDTEVKFFDGEKEYKFLGGMTWRDYVDSSYNTDGFYIKDGIVYGPENKIISCDIDLVFDSYSYFYPDHIILPYLDINPPEEL